MRSFERQSLEKEESAGFLILRNICQGGRRERLQPEVKGNSESSNIHAQDLLLDVGLQRWTRQEEFMSSRKDTYGNRQLFKKKTMKNAIMQ